MMKCLVQKMLLLLLSVLLTSLCQSQLSWVAVAESVHYVDTISTYLDCIEEFLEHQVNISSNFVESVKLCQIIAINQKLSHDNDKQKEREELIAASVKLCERLDACTELEMEHDFFNCHAEAGHGNMLLITNMHINATQALVDLEDSYNEAEKQRLHCYLEAEREYKIQTITAQQELTTCIEASSKESRRKRLSTKYMHGSKT